MELGHYTPAIATLVLGSISLLILSRLTQRASNIDAPSLVLQLIFWGAGLAVVVALVVALPLEALGYLQVRKLPYIAPGSALGCNCP